MTDSYTANSTSFSQPSATAMSSFIFGIASIFGMFTCFSPIVTSLLAIGLGHAALGKIKASGGQLLGASNAKRGLVLGYVCLPLSLALTGLFQ